MVVWLLIISLIRDLWQIKSGFKRIEESNARLAEAESQNKALKEKLNLVSTDEYKEKLIREELNMQKIGEVVAVLPKTEIASEAVQNTINETKTSNLEKWWALLK